MSNPFEGTEPIVSELYELLLSKLESIGTYDEETKKTSIHLTKRAAFLGVHPKKTYLELNVVSDCPLEAKRGYRTEQVSKNRFHNRIRIEKPGDLDQRLMKDIASGYRLMS
jgi:hypothetical protein